MTFQSGNQVGLCEAHGVSNSDTRKVAALDHRVDRGPADIEAGCDLPDSE